MAASRTATAAASALTAPPPVSALLRRLYFARFAFAVVWAALLFPNAKHTGALLTVLLVVYPLVDAAAVLSQLRSEPATRGLRVSQRVNVAVSVVVAITLGWASTVSTADALAVWGVWAAASGATQLITALSRRSRGGQVPQIVSGAISIAAGAGFLARSAKHPAGISAIGGYAVLGGVFFLISAICLRTLPRRTA